MSKKGKHGVRNPKKAKPNPYDKRRKRKPGWDGNPEEGRKWTRQSNEEFNNE